MSDPVVKHNDLGEKPQPRKIPREPRAPQLRGDHPDVAYRVKLNRPVPSMKGTPVHMPLPRPSFSFPDHPTAHAVHPMAG